MRTGGVIPAACLARVSLPFLYLTENREPGYGTLDSGPTPDYCWDNGTLPDRLSCRRRRDGPRLDTSDSTE